LSAGGCSAFFGGEFGDDVVLRLREQLLGGASVDRLGGLRRMSAKHHAHERASE
jgi:hypothetical protein